MRELPRKLMHMGFGLLIAFTIRMFGLINPEYGNYIYIGVLVALIVLLAPLSLRIKKGKKVFLLSKIVEKSERKKAKLPGITTGYFFFSVIASLLLFENETAFLGILCAVVVNC